MIFNVFIVNDLRIFMLLRRIVHSARLGTEWRIRSVILTQRGRTGALSSLPSSGAIGSAEPEPSLAEAEWSARVDPLPDRSQIVGNEAIELQNEPVLRVGEGTVPADAAVGLTFRFLDGPCGGLVWSRLLSATGWCWSGRIWPRLQSVKRPAHARSVRKGVGHLAEGRTDPATAEPSPVSRSAAS